MPTNSPREPGERSTYRQQQGRPRPKHALPPTASPAQDPTPTYRTTLARAQRATPAPLTRRARPQPSPPTQHDSAPSHQQQQDDQQEPALPSHQGSNLPARPSPCHTSPLHEVSTGQVQPYLPASERDSVGRGVQSKHCTPRADRAMVACPGHTDRLSRCVDATKPARTRRPGPTNLTTSKSMTSTTTPGRHALHNESE